eukprot:602659-Amphidinium_carterae.1
MAHQEVNGGVSVGGFDFLKSGGGWVIACPCGQQHPINQCPEGTAGMCSSAERTDYRNQNVLPPPPPPTVPQNKNTV